MRTSGKTDSAQGAAGESCPLCGSADLVSVIDIPDVPIFCNVLWSSAGAARKAPRGRIALSYCPSCTHLHNRSFDPVAVQYAPDYENSLHFSDRFNTFAANLAERLVARYDLRATTIVELGCGQGDFLRMICAAGENRGIGFDPSYSDEPSAPSHSDGLDLEIRRRLFGAEDHGLRPSLVCCRHVLEHVPDPRSFIAELYSWLASRPDTTLYFEVPNARYTLEHGGVWDLIYEHHSYFTLESLVGVFQDIGFHVQASGQAFGGQYIYVEAGVSPSPVGQQPLTSEISSRDALRRNVEAFGRTFESLVTDWQQRLQEAHATGSSVGLWGAGSKGATFLNVVDPGKSVSFVVDISPRKQGKHVAGTGHRVVPPHSLLERSCDTMVVMNPLYVEEIAGMLHELGVSCRLVVP